MDQSESESQTIQPEVKEILGILQQCDQVHELSWL